MITRPTLWLPTYEDEELIEEGQWIAIAQVFPVVRDALILNLESPQACDYDDVGSWNLDDRGDDELAALNHDIVSSAQEKNLQLAASMLRANNVLIEPYTADPECNNVQVSLFVRLGDTSGVLDNFRPLSTGLCPQDMSTVTPEEWQRLCLYGLADIVQRQRRGLMTTVPAEPIFNDNRKIRQLYECFKRAEPDNLAKGLHFV